MKKLSIKNEKSVVAEFALCILWFAALVSPLPVLAGMFAENRIIFHGLLLLSGWLAWTFTEYCMHRFEDHGEHTKDGSKPEKLHHHHHKHPTEIAISPLHRIGLIALCAGLIFLAVWLNNWVTVIPGLVIGFTSYTFVHWFLHHKISASIFPELHRFHIHHHCKHPDKCFGITVTWWDHLFGTVPVKNTEITERILTFYYKKEKKPEKKIISLNNIIDEKIRYTGKQSA